MREFCDRFSNGGYKQSLSSMRDVLENRIGESVLPGIDCARDKVIRLFRSAGSREQQNVYRLLRIGSEKSMAQVRKWCSLSPSITFYVWKEGVHLGVVGSRYTKVKTTEAHHTTCEQHARRLFRIPS